MHIPDAYLSPATEGVAFAAMVPMWAIAGRRTVRDLSTKQAPLLSIGAAFCFAVQMFNIPAIGGTTAHALGATLLAILVGPWAALLGMTLTLVIQALLFGDGGILSLGANCWDMGFIACFVGYGTYRLVSGRSPVGSSRHIVGAGIGAYVGTVAASLSAGILLGIQPVIAHDLAGHALYCPFGLNVSIPAMVTTHLLVAGPAEAIITVAALAYLWKAFPEFATAKSRPTVGSGLRIARKLGWVLALTPIGLLAGGGAWGEWDISVLREKIGYVPAGAAKTHELVHPLLPDYGFAGLAGRPWEIAGYLVSAFIGCALVAAFTRGVLMKAKAPTVEPRAIGTPSKEIPSWLRAKNPELPQAIPAKASWFEATLLRMRSTVAKTVAAETIARSSGLLQSIHPLAKTIGFLSGLIATGLARSPWPLIFLISLAMVVAQLSSVPLKGLAIRVGGAVLFFGAIVAVPLSLQSVTSGPLAFEVLGVAVSKTGLYAALMILLRLASAISLAILWNLTTRWHQLLKSLRSIGVPQMFLTTATLTYRYLFVMMETLAEMVAARISRQIGACDKRQARQYAGNGAAILFAKSLAFTEEMHMAMQSRSFESVPKTARKVSWKLADSAAVIAGLTTLAAVVLQGVYHAI